MPRDLSELQYVFAVALGTYYTPDSPAARDAKNVSSMRGLTYFVKNNRPKPPDPQYVNHPRHPKGRVRITTAAQAYDYIVDAYAAGDRQRLRRALDLGSWGADEVALVPIPTSQTTDATDTTKPWPGLELARRLERLGLGTLCVAAVNANARPSKTSGSSARKPTADELAENLVVIERLRRFERVVYVDDVITHGRSVVAMDAVLSPKKRCSALAVAFNDGSACADCFDVRRRRIHFDRDVVPWRVEITEAPPTSATED